MSRKVQRSLFRPMRLKILELRMDGSLSEIRVNSGAFGGGSGSACSLIGAIDVRLISAGSNSDGVGGGREAGRVNSSVSGVVGRLVISIRWKRSEIPEKNRATMSMTMIDRTRQDRLVIVPDMVDQY